MTSERVQQNSQKAIEMVRSLLIAGNLDPQEESRPDQTIFRMVMEGPAPKSVVRILIDKQRYIAHFHFERAAPPELRGKVAEYITRVNYGLITGNLEMSFDTGAIRYRTSIDFTNIELPVQMVRNAMLAAMENIERIAIPLWDVLDEDAAPEAAAAVTSPPEDVAPFEEP